MSYHRAFSLRRLLPAESRAAEMTSAMTLLATGIYIAAAFIPGQTVIGPGVALFGPQAHLPAVQVAAALIVFPVLHLFSLCLNYRGINLRRTMIFAEFFIWNYAASGAWDKSVYPVPGAPALVCCAFAVSTGWCFLVRNLLIEKPGPNGETTNYGL